MSARSRCETQHEHRCETHYEHLTLTSAIASRCAGAWYLLVSLGKSSGEDERGDPYIRVFGVKELRRWRARLRKDPF